MSHTSHTFVGVKFYGKATRITRGISRALFTTDSRESKKSLGLLSNTVKEIGRGEVADIVGHFELSISTSTLGVNHSLGNSLA